MKGACRSFFSNSVTELHLKSFSIGQFTLWSGPGTRFFLPARSIHSPEWTWDTFFSSRQVHSLSEVDLRHAFFSPSGPFALRSGPEAHLFALSRSTGRPAMTDRACIYAPFGHSRLRLSRNTGFFGNDRIAPCGRCVRDTRILPAVCGTKKIEIPIGISIFNMTRTRLELVLPP